MPKRLELSGRYGYLDIICFSHMQGGNSLWKCRCICGNIVVKLGFSLVSGHTKSCGCKSKEEISKRFHSAILPGEVYSRWTVLKFSHVKKRATYWTCKCVCGNIKIVSGNSLRQGRSKSCGCLRIESITKHGASYTNEYKNVFTHMRRERAQMLDFHWNHYLEKCLCEFQKVCAICGSDKNLSTDHIRPLSKGFGLVPLNATRLCKSCNSRKNDKDLDELHPDIVDKLVKSSVAFDIKVKTLGVLSEKSNCMCSI